MADTRFNDLLDEIRELHARKAADYGDDDDPFANIRASEQFGVPAWQGAIIRLNDKVHRLARFAKRGKLANESAKDSMMDIAVYALIAYLLYGEASGEQDTPKYDVEYDEISETIWAGLPDYEARKYALHYTIDAFGAPIRKYRKLVKS